MLEDRSLTADGLTADKLLRSSLQRLSETFEARLFHTEFSFGLATGGCEHKKHRKNGDQHDVWTIHDLLFPLAGVAFSGGVVHRWNTKIVINLQNKSVIQPKETT